ncbi:hypothetical protein E2C01_042926 [Portunus trituberculatus]|uniref:Uncharacterized protein n=1 Tax=Portunus trituberculatus TaxID=210409 RepID=A0A5B7FNU9_PORTR|nr:hypothetical protein [Portunus trituberculatus]
MTYFAAVSENKVTSGTREITQTHEGSRKLSKSRVILSKTQGAASTPPSRSLPPFHLRQPLSGPLPHVPGGASVGEWLGQDDRAPTDRLNFATMAQYMALYQIRFRSCHTRRPSVVGGSKSGYQL